MKSKIFLILILIAIGVLTYFGYPIIKERYFKSEKATEIEKQESPTSTGSSFFNETDKDESASDASDAVEDSAVSDEIKNEADESGDASNITAEDCDNECENFKDSSSDLRYCQDICGLSGSQSGENCEEKSGSDKDYCLKNQAVSKKDLDICNSISDSKIKSSCKSRVTEEILEQQSSN